MVHSLDFMQARHGTGSRADRARASRDRNPLRYRRHRGARLLPGLVSGSFISARAKKGVRMSHVSDIIKIQRWAGAVPDGNFGPVSANAVVQKLGLDVLPDEEPEWRSGKASSFADPKDVAAFKRCKAQGKTDQQCFRVGDNGIGLWGDDTTTPEPA